MALNTYTFNDGAPPKRKLRIEGFIIKGNGERVEVSQNVGRNYFTPNVNRYYEKLVTRCRKFFRGEGMNDL
jgi:hypothetical protein